MPNPMIAIVLLLLFFTACEDKEHLAKEQAIHDAKIAHQARAELLAELEAKKEVEKKEDEKKNEKLHHLGIHMENGTITIDTNKTKNFFSDLNTKMVTQIQKINEDMENGVIDAKEVGVEIDEKHIHIDINKTQNAFQSWVQKMQMLAEEFQTVTKSLEANTTNKGI
jgi:hypothetical protein